MTMVEDVFRLFSCPKLYCWTSSNKTYNKLYLR